MHTAMIVLFVLQFAIATNLEGRIYVAGTHNPAPVTRVRIERLGMPIREVFAQDGRFLFRDLLPGRYTILFDSPGYETSHSEVILPDESFEIIELRPKEAPLPGNTQQQGGSQTFRRLLHKLFR
jgi:hypothetical protein